MQDERFNQLVEKGRLWSRMGIARVLKVGDLGYKFGFSK
jgi:hypothetical protein